VQEEVSPPLLLPDEKKFQWPKFNLGNFVAGSFFGAVAVVMLLFFPFLAAEDSSFESSSSNAAGVSKAGNVPVKSAEERVRESVSLFDNILTDLRLGYVDEIDPKQLFETGVGAMLRSLDPYTEFENYKAAKEIQESVR